jgi:hypothetical protein
LNPDIYIAMSTLGYVITLSETGQSLVTSAFPVD